MQRLLATREASTRFECVHLYVPFAVAPELGIPKVMNVS